MGIVVRSAIVELRSLFAFCNVDISGGELFVKTWSNISNGVGVIGLSFSGVVS